jgi:hypothetical protein
MQILIQVVCSKGRSLRQEIVKDGKLDKYGLSVSEEKRPGRPHGWAKVHSTGYDRHGAINIEWDAKTNVLLCRVVTRGAGKPNQIIGDFVDYLLRKFPRRVMAINIIPR